MSGAETTIEQAVLEGARKMKAAGIESYMLESRIFMEKASGLSRVKLYTEGGSRLGGEIAERFFSMVERRLRRVPAQYITGECEFMGLNFIVNESVLVPRADTEIAVELAVECIKERGYKAALDIGTGSGAIAVSIAHYSGISVVAADISRSALKTAEKNAELNNVSDSIKFVQSNIFESICGQFDIIVSNPPYIPSGDIAGLMPEVRDYEPRLALDGGRSGLDFYRRIAEGAGGFLSPGGSLVLETGCEQGEAVSEILEGRGFSDVRIHRDLAGLNRVVHGVKE